MIIRRAIPEDAEALFGVHRASVNEFCAGSYTPEHMAEWFLGRTPEMYQPSLQAGRIWLAESEGQAVGFVEAIPGEVTLLFVSPKASGRSVGSKLLALGVEVASGAARAPVTVIATRNSVSFYQRHGFVVVGEQHFVRGEPPREYPVVKLVWQAASEHSALPTDA